VVVQKDSISQQTGKHLKNIIITSLSIAVILLLVNQFLITPNKNIDNSVRRSIAVLAFKDMSPEQDQEYFSDGISEELLNLLAKIPQLRVISRTSAFSYKGKNETLETIGRELDVTHILEGSVRKSENKLRITAQLIQVDDGSHMWSETYDRNMEDIFKIQDEIAAIVIEQLKIKLLNELPNTTEVDPEAYSLYLQAQYFYRHSSDEGNIKAEETIRQSIVIDSTYAPSWFLLSAIIRESAFNLSLIPSEKGLELAIAAAQKAIDLDDKYAPPYALLSILYLTDLDYKSAKRNINKAMMLDGGNTFVVSSAALNAGYSGRIEEALELYNKSLQLDPLRYRIHLNIGIGYYWLNRLDDAYNAVQKYMFYTPNAAIHHSVNSRILIGQGKYDEALEEARKETNEFFNLYSRNLAMFAIEKYSEADSLLIKIVEKYGKTHLSNIAEIYAFRGELDNAFNWLDLAFEQSDNNLIEAINEPTFSNLHNDPRWQILLENMKLPIDHWLLKK
jgi:TolB-like protein/lipoprotein NlpI